MGGVGGIGGGGMDGVDTGVGGRASEVGTLPISEVEGKAEKIGLINVAWWCRHNLC